MTDNFELTLPAYERGFHLIDQEVLDFLVEETSLPDAGILHLFILHTSAALCINENASPDVLSDLETYFNSIVPEDLPGIQHSIEGPDDMPAHVKAALIGNHIALPIVNGRLKLGAWQGIVLCEFRNEPRRRTLLISICA